MPLYHIYCDESSTTTGRFMVIGGIIFPSIASADIQRGMSNKKDSLGLLHEIKWDTISNNNVDRYIELFKYFYYLTQAGKICFKAIVVDKSKYDNKKHINIKDTPFYKMYFQLLYHKFCKLWYKQNKNSLFAIFPDEKSSNISLLDLKSYLNKTIRNYLGGGTVVTEIIPQVSENSIVIQIIDLFIGAMTYYLNGHMSKPEASKAKKKFIQAIQEEFKTDNFCLNTTLKEQRFEIWNINFYERK